METQIFTILRTATALIVGGVIGYSFGLIQERARLRHERQQREGKFKGGWSATPGSFSRIGYLLVALAAVQYLCPMLFDARTVNPWCVSGGVALGYGAVLFGQIRHLRAQLRQGR